MSDTGAVERAARAVWEDARTLARKVLAAAMPSVEQVAEVLCGPPFACDRCTRKAEQVVRAEKSPSSGLWSKRSHSSGNFVTAKRSGDAFKGIRKEN